jgi:hypothetical protein
VQRWFKYKHKNGTVESLATQTNRDGTQWLSANHADRYTDMQSHFCDRRLSSRKAGSEADLEAALLGHTRGHASSTTVGSQNPSHNPSFASDAQHGQTSAIRLRRLYVSAHFSFAVSLRRSVRTLCNSSEDSAASRVFVSLLPIVFFLHSTVTGIWFWFLHYVQLTRTNNLFDTGDVGMGPPRTCQFLVPYSSLV